MKRILVKVRPETILLVRAKLVEMGAKNGEGRHLGYLKMEKNEIYYLRVSDDNEIIHGREHNFHELRTILKEDDYPEEFLDDYEFLCPDSVFDKI